MGEYVYTLRKQTRVIDGRTIGRFDYAYKDSSDQSAAFKRRKATMWHHAGKARWANPDLRLAIVGEFKDAVKQPLPVFEISDTITGYLDGISPGPVVGYVEKYAGTFRFVPKQ